jgi:hypothetical protein
MAAIWLYSKTAIWQPYGSLPKAAISSILLLENQHPKGAKFFGFLSLNNPIKTVFAHARELGKGCIGGASAPPPGAKACARGRCATPKARTPGSVIEIGGVRRLPSDSSS